MSLLALQRDFRSWLTTESADAGSRIEAGEAPGLSVYLNNYRSSLMACLMESFGTTRAWLGDEAFAAASAYHIEGLPPHSWTLDAYALGLPDTLAAIYLADPKVADLARIERALGVAFVGPDASAIDPTSLADVDWDAAAIGFVPTLELVIVTTDAAAIWSAIAAGERLPSVEIYSEPICIAVWRADLTPAFRTLEPGEAEALRWMIEGHRFGDLCTRLVDRHGEEQGLSLAGALLGQWLQNGIVTAIRETRSLDEVRSILT